MIETEELPAEVDQAAALRSKQAGALRACMSWMMAISALTALNVVAAFTAFPLRLVVGLTLTEILMAIGLGGGTTTTMIAVVSSLVIAGALFALAWGFKHSDHFTWAPIVFALFYSMDMILALIFQDYISVLFHGLALFYIIRGYLAFRALIRDQRSAPPTPIAAEAAPVTSPSDVSA